MGRIYTARGQLSEDESETYGPHRVLLWDGRWDTAWKVISFRVFGASSGGNTTGDAMGKLCTSNRCERGPGDFFNADDPREIAWSQNSGSLDSGAGGGFGEQIIDRDNFIIEDLWVYIRGVSDAQDINYVIEMEQYNISDWEGAMLMARDRAIDVV